MRGFAAETDISLLKMPDMRLFRPRLLEILDCCGGCRCDVSATFGGLSRALQRWVAATGRLSGNLDCDELYMDVDARLEELMGLPPTSRIYFLRGGREDVLWSTFVRRVWQGPLWWGAATLRV
jgi:hypothetical protein